MADIFDDNIRGGLKSRWLDSFLKNIYGTNAGLTALGKPTKSGGREHKFVLNGGGAAVGADFGVASAAANGGQLTEVTVPVAKMYGVGYVSNVAGISAEGNENAVVDLYAQQESDARARLAQRINHMILVSRGFGECSYVKSHTGTTGTVTITLQNPHDSRLYRKGDTIVLKDDPATASLRTGSVLITKVAPGVLTGTCQDSADLSAGSGADGAAIGFKGDMANDTNRTGIIGLKAWLTRTSGDLTNFCGIADRTVDEVSMAGHYADLQTMSCKDAIDKLCDMLSAVADANPSVCLVSIENFRQLQGDLGDNTPIGNFTGSFPKDTAINFRSISFVTASGKSVEVVPSHDLDKEIFILDPMWAELVTPNAEIITKNASGDGGWFSMESAGVDAHKFKALALVNLAVTAPQCQAAGLFS